MTEIMDVLTVMALGLWLFLPAYVPNSNAALIGKRWGKVKMDFGKTISKLDDFDLKEKVFKYEDHLSKYEFTIKYPSVKRVS